VGEPTQAAELDPGALRLWCRAVDIRAACLLATGLPAAAVPAIGDRRLFLVLGSLLVTLPYNLVLRHRLRTRRRLDPAMPVIDVLLATAFAVVVPIGWPAVAASGVASVALAVVAFGRRNGLVVTAVGLVGLLPALWQMDAGGDVVIGGFAISSAVVLFTLGFVTHQERNLRDRHTALVNGVAGITWEWDPTTHEILFMSPQVRSILGWTVDEAMRTSTWIERCHPEDLGDGSPQAKASAEFRVRHADGRWVWMRELRSWSPQGTIRSIAFDVTREREADLALRQYADIIEHLPISLVVWQLTDADDPCSLAVRSANPAAAPVFGRPVEDLSGRRLVDMLPGEEYVRFARAVARCINAAGSAVFAEIPFQATDGSEAYYTIRVVPLPDRCAALLTEDVTDQRRADAALRHLALHDPLTGLPNRALLQERLVAGLDASREVALLVLDLDQFKEINDTLGHATGDRLLEQVGTRLSAVLQDCDTVARLGGDEFAVLLTSEADRTRAEEVARRIADTLGEPFDLLGISVQVPASIGIALSPEHGSDAEVLAQRADIAMYNAKRAGGTHAFYTCEDDRSSLRRLSLVGELRRALERDELVLHFQPQVEVATRRVVGVEALVRWEHPEHGLLPPSEFIGLAEVSGTIQPLTRWVIRRAVSHASTLARSGHPLVMAANVSARNLYDPDLVEGVRRALEDFALPPELLLLELTESELVDDPSQVMTVLGRLNDMGVQIAVDDFGTGWSSLANLTQLPIDQVKVDRSFVSRMLQGGDDAVVVRSIIDLGHNLGLTVVAEGVEDEATFAALAALGCDHAQGYLLSRPVPATELATWLAARQAPSTVVR
jgi:diguanylate cyclase (GGDEF)-like protein